MSKKHSKWAASAMERWSECPGSVRECEGMQSISSAAAEEGTFAHDMAEGVLRSTLSATKFAELPEEMQEAIKVYTNTIFDDFFELKYPDTENKCELMIEHFFDLSSIFPGAFGTADAVLWNPVTRVLRVYDFKYGKGHFVEVMQNLQMQVYGLGALLTLKGINPKWIELVVVQPRCVRKKSGPVRRWRFPALEILEFEEFFLEKANATLDPKAPLVPGRYCFWCPAHTKCPAKAKERLKAAIDSFSEIDEDDDNPFS